LALGLADTFRVLEPWQRGSVGEPLTVAGHVADLHELVESKCDGAKPALVGESWGAMLALAYSAAHPNSAGLVVLVGCGTFDPVSRTRMKEIREERKTDELRLRLELLAKKTDDPGELLCKQYELSRYIDIFDPIPTTGEPSEEPYPPFDMQAHTETWEDMLRLQDEGVYPSAFSAIVSPVIMLHGAYDPHPGRMIYASLKPHIPQIEYQEWELCGHSPWIEKHARDDFFSFLHQWLAEKLQRR
jgi:pimeloyl-ACP methyl ester carboxylesterase